MNADEVATEVVLATEGPAAGPLRADVRLEPVGVMGSHVGLQIVGASKGCEEVSVEQRNDK